MLPHSLTVDKVDPGGDPEAFPAQIGYVIPPVCALGSPPSWTCPEYFQREVASCSDARTASFGFSLMQNAQQFDSGIPPDIWAPQPVPEDEPRQKFILTSSKSPSIGHYPKLMTEGEGWNLDRQVISEFRLRAELALRRCSLVSSARINLPVDLTLHLTLTHKQDHKIFELIASHSANPHRDHSPNEVSRTSFLLASQTLPTERSLRWPQRTAFRYHSSFHEFSLKE